MRLEKPLESSGRHETRDRPGPVADVVLLVRIALHGVQP